MTQLQKLRSATTLTDLAELLNFKRQAITYLLFKQTDAERYFEFEISKQSGGKRTIAAPNERLKRLQSNLAHLLEHCLMELEETGVRKTPFVHGFIKGKSIVTNAKIHRNKRWVLNLDLHDFFGTVNFGRVRGTLIKDTSFQLHPTIATLIAQIACRNNALPQGAPSSPILANMVTRPLDLRLVDIANHYGLRYSRYADDITFSTRIRDFPLALVDNSSSEGCHVWVLGNKLEKAITKAGFTVNPKKTRLQYLESRQEVTGLVVNRRVNVTREYRKKVRAMVHSLVSTGAFHLDAAGTARVANKQTKAVDPLRQLQGMLGFIDWVDSRGRILKDNRDEQAHLQRDKKAHKVKDLPNQERQYRKFLFYREFFAMDRPVILTEGKTDKVHLYAAIKQQAALFPLLADTSSNPPTSSVRVFPGAERRTSALMGLSGGTANLAAFISEYEAETKKFFKPSARHPIIVLVDLDNGWKAVKKAIEKKTGGIAPDGSKDFYYLGSNLYVVCIPPPPGAVEGCIEELHTEALLKKDLGGKYFDKSNNTTDEGKHFGKFVFAEKVVKPNAKSIDFMGFNPLLHRLSTAIAAHSAGATAIAT